MKNKELHPSQGKFSTNVAAKSFFSQFGNGSTSNRILMKVANEAYSSQLLINSLCSFKIF